MSYLNLAQTRQLVAEFPKVSTRMRNTLRTVRELVLSDYKQLQTKLVLRYIEQYYPRRLTEFQLLLESCSHMPSQLFYHLACGDEIGKCTTCGAVTTFRTSCVRFLEFCGNDCASKHTAVRRIKTWRAKYGVDNPTKTAAVRSAISNSLRERNKTGSRRTKLLNDPPIPKPPKFAVSDKYYVYVLLDPRKTSCTYGRFRFKHQPFYVGKGHGDRYLSHFKSAGEEPKHRNSIKSSVIRKIIDECGMFPEVRFFKCSSEQEAYYKEIQLIAAIGRRDKKTGPLCNHTRGGEGIAGRHWTDEQRRAQSERVKAYFATLTPEQRSAHCNSKGRPNASSS